MKPKNKGRSANAQGAVEDAAGLTLGYDITKIVQERKKAGLSQRTDITEADIPKLRCGKTPCVEPEEQLLHEDEVLYGWQKRPARLTLTEPSQEVNFVRRLSK